LAHIDSWVTGGLISAEQAERIKQFESRSAAGAPPAEPRPEGPALVTEALGYLGGVIMIVASIWVTAELWPDMSTAARLALVGGAALLLLGAGAAVPQRAAEVGARLRSVLWLLSTLAAAGFAALVATETLDWVDEDVAAAATTTALIWAAALWFVHRELLQQVAFFVALAASGGAWTATLGGTIDDAAEIGLAVAAVGAVWVLLAWGGLLTYRTVAMVLGTVMAILGAAMTMSAPDWGYYFVVAVLVVAVAFALYVRSLGLIAVAAVGALQTLPAVMAHFFEGSVAAPLALVGVGAVMVGAAIFTARRNRTSAESAQGHARRRRGAEGSRTVAVTAAAVVVAAAVVAILAVGL